MKSVLNGVTLLVLLIISGAVAAVPIIITAERGVVIGDTSGDIFGSVSPSTALGAFTDTASETLGSSPGKVVSAEQTSDIQAVSGVFSGTGATSVGVSLRVTDRAHADSFFDVFFEISVDHTYTLDGFLKSKVDGGHGEARFQLAGPTGINLGAVGFDDISLASSGLLTAGSYRLQVFSTVNPGRQVGGYMAGSAEFDFNLKTQAVVSAPEPATLALLGIGLAGIGFRKKKTEPLSFTAEREL